MSGKRITFLEKLRYDKCVSVCFQVNAWCDEPIMTQWVRHHWKPHVEGPKMLLLDQHKAQKTPTIEGLLSSECNTTTVLIPPGCISLVQPLDVVFNAPFKCLIDDLATSHMRENLDGYVHGNISAKQHRILLTTWIGEAWEKTCANRDMVVRGFRKCGISLAIDDSKDDVINIKGIENYQVDSGDDDPFESEGDSFEDDLSESDTVSSTDDDVDVQTTGEVLSDGEYSIIDLCENMLDSNCTLAESIVPEDSITFSETFLPTSCDFVPMDVEDVVVNLPEASDFMQV